MNYRSELRGFALDRATRLIEAKALVAEPFELAEKIVELPLHPEKDIDSHLQTLFPLIRQANDVELIGNLILTLEAGQG